MKKILIAIFSMIISVNAMALTFEGKLGFSSDFLEQDGVYFNMGLDIYGEQRTILQPGIGFLFADFYSADGDSDLSTLDKLPVYGIAKFNLVDMGGAIFFLKAFGGWQFFDDSNYDGGLYYGYGLGLDVSKISVEYFLTKENYKVNGLEVDNDFGTIAVEYYFN